MLQKQPDTRYVPGVIVVVAAGHAIYKYVPTLQATKYPTVDNVQTRSQNNQSAVRQ